MRVAAAGCRTFTNARGWETTIFRSRFLHFLFSPRYQVTICNNMIYIYTICNISVLVLSPFSTSITCFVRHQQNVLDGSDGCRRGSLAPRCRQTSGMKWRVSNPWGYPVHHPFSWDFPWFSILNPAGVSIYGPKSNMSNLRAELPETPKHGPYIPISTGLDELGV